MYFAFIEKPGLLFDATSGSRPQQHPCVSGRCLVANRSGEILELLRSATTPQQARSALERAGFAVARTPAPALSWALQGC
jgi:hypothetical protein